MNARPAAKKPPPAGQGAACRLAAAEVIGDVLFHQQALDVRLEKLAAAGLSAADRSLASAIAVTAIRRLGTIRQALKARLAEGFPRGSGLLEPILIGAAAQILFLDVPDHAAVTTAVDAARADKHARHFAGLANAVLRALARDRAAVIAASDPLLSDLAPWLRQRWVTAYGEAQARAMAAAGIAEPPLDVTCPRDTALWAERLDAAQILAGTLRLRPRTGIADLPGYADGAWWVQDAAAAIPARLMRFPAGGRVLDMCAAPGGKTAQLIARGAAVTALDRSGPRMQRLSANLARLKMQARVRIGDALQFEAEAFDAVLIDAPCSATGTIRRHPDVAWVKGEADIAKLTQLQAKLLAHGAALVKPGGCMVYSTCSLEPDEGEAQVSRFLADHPGFARDPVEAAELPGLAEAVTRDGDIRTFPFHLPSDDPRMAGLDGFFAARLRRLPQ